MGESTVAGRLADVQSKVYAPLISLARRSPLGSGALGHAVHPPLTDVTAGCWIAASVVDLLGGRSSKHAAEVLVTVGFVASVPTALAGAADWSQTSGQARSIGAVHAVGTDLATFLFLCSLVARRRGSDTAGVGYALAGNVVMGAAGVLGAHLALNRGVARRSAAPIGQG